MEDKYYTPEIEEFHVGFECEMGLNGCWSKCKIVEHEEEWNEGSTKTLGAKSEFGDASNVFCNHSYQYRVKYLSREDIESVGFKITREEIKPYGTYYEGYFKGKSISTNTEIWYANLTGKLPYIILKTKHYNGNCRCHIKNKSEFSRLLRQLSII